MKNLIALSAWLIILSSFCAISAYAHSESQTNLLIQTMLRSSLVRPNYDINSRSFKTLPRTVVDQQEFFAPDGDWSEVEKRAAFEWYLRHLSSTARQRGMVAGRTRSENPIACAAMAQCEVMFYTNALPIFIENINKPFDPSRLSAIRVVIAWSPVNSNLTDIVEGIVTNEVYYTLEERNVAYRSFCSRLCTGVSLGEFVESGMDAMFAHRTDPVGAVAVDKLLAKYKPRYSNSVDRVACAISVLNNDMATISCIDYFTHVTNILMNVIAPLDTNNGDNL